MRWVLPEARCDVYLCWPVARGDGVNWSSVNIFRHYCIGGTQRSVLLRREEKSIIHVDEMLMSLLETWLGSRFGTTRADIKFFFARRRLIKKIQFPVYPLTGMFILIFRESRPSGGEGRLVYSCSLRSPSVVQQLSYYFDH